MKMALINGSPKVSHSASGCLLEELKAFLDEDNNEISEYYFRQVQLTNKDMEELLECDVLVFALPLYVDGIPSHLLNCLIQMEQFFSTIKEKNIKVYSLVNCGFYEGHQNSIAIEIMKNWCEKAGLQWGQGLGIGAGGIISSLKGVKIGYGPKKNLGLSFKELSNNILINSSGDDIFITANFPRRMYKLLAEMGWRKSIKANGLKKKDLFLRK